MLYSVYRQTVRTVSCYAVSADRLYVLCHVIQCLQTDCTYCVMLYSVCRQTVCTVSCYVIQCLRKDSTYCVMLYSVCRQTVFFLYTFILHAPLLDSNTTCNCVFFLHYMTTDYSIYRLVLQLLGYFWSL